MGNSILSKKQGIKTMTTIKQLLDMPIGKDSRGGGYELTVKYSRKAVEHKGKWLQAVVFVDDTGEIPGEILLEKYIPVQKGYKIHVTVGWLQASESGKKLYVEQWYINSMSMAEYEASKYDFQQEMRYGEPLNIVRGKCRMHLVLKFRQEVGFVAEISDRVKTIIESDIDYILKDITDGNS